MSCTRQPCRKSWSGFERESSCHYQRIRQLLEFNRDFQYDFPAHDEARAFFVIFFPLHGFARVNAIVKRNWETCSHFAPAFTRGSKHAPRAPLPTSRHPTPPAVRLDRRTHAPSGDGLELSFFASQGIEHTIDRDDASGWTLSVAETDYEISPNPIRQYRLETDTGGGGSRSSNRVCSSTGAASFGFLLNIFFLLVERGRAESNG